MHCSYAGILEEEIRWGKLGMSLMNIKAIQTFITCDRIEVEKATACNLPEKAVGIAVQECHWNYYKDVFGNIIKDSDFLLGWSTSSPMKKAYKYKHPVYGSLRFISPRIELNLMQSCIKYPRILRVWSA